MTADRIAAAAPYARRNLRLFYGFRLLATSYFYVPLFMLVQGARGLSNFEQYALGGIFSAVIIAAEIPTGVLADRIGRRRSMMAGAAAMVVSTLIAADAHSFPAFAIAEILAALSMALCSGADSAYLFDLLANANCSGEYGRCESAASAWHLLGCAIAYAGSGLLADIDSALPYRATSIAAALAFVAASLLRNDDREAAARRSVTASALRSSWSLVTAAILQVTRNARLAWIVGYSALAFMLLRSTGYVYQPYLADRGEGLTAIGLIFSGVYVAASIVAFFTHRARQRFGEQALLWTLLGALAISFIGLANVHSAAIMWSLLAVQAAANGVYSPLTKPIINREVVDGKSRAAVLSAESMARRSAMAVFAPLLGVYSEANVMMVCGTVAVVGTGLLAIARVRPQYAPAIPLTEQHRTSDLGPRTS